MYFKLTSKEKILWIGVTYNAACMITGSFALTYLLSKGISIEQVAILKSFQALLILISDAPLSFIADRGNKRECIIGSIVCSVLWIAVTIFANSFFSFLVAEIFNAIAIALFGGAFIALLLEGSEGNSLQEKSLLIARYKKYDFIFMMIAGVVGGIVFSYGSNSGWIVAGILCCAILVVSFLHLPSDAQTVKAKLTTRPAVFSQIKSSVSTPILVAGSLLIVNITMYQIAIQIWQLILFSELSGKQDSTYIYGAVFGLNMLSQAFVSFLFEKANFKKYNVAQILIGTCVLAVVLLALWWWRTYFVVTSVSLMFAISTASHIFLSALFHSLVPDDERAFQDSIVSTVSRVFLLPGIPAVSMLITDYGFILPSIILSLNVAITLIALFVQRWLSPDTHRSLRA